jgi:hypothetical protein
VFPLASVAVQVTVVTPIGNKPLAGALFVKVTVVQLSAAVGAVNTTTALQLFPAVAVMATGVLIVGTVVSVTVTNCVLVTVFPAASVAVQVTTVFPIGKVAGALLLNVTPLQLSAAVGAVNTTVAVHPDPAVAVIATGVVNVGAVTSITVIVCVAVPVFPLASVAVHVTVVFPTGNVAGALFVKVILFGAVQLSITAGAVNTTVAVQFDPAFAVIVAGAEITGAIASVTVTV